MTCWMGMWIPRCASVLSMILDRGPSATVNLLNMKQDILTLIFYKCILSKYMLQQHP